MQHRDSFRRYYPLALTALLLSTACGQRPSSTATSTQSQAAAPSTPSANATKQAQAPAAAAGKGLVKLVPLAQRGGSQKAQALASAQADAQVGTPVALQLDLGQSGPWSKSPGDWRNVEIDRLVVREPGNLQRSLVESRYSKDSQIELSIDQAGTSQLIYCIESPRGAKGDAAQQTRPWTYCARRIIRVADAKGHVPDTSAEVGGKVGDRIELRPMMDPLTAHVGADMGFRVYLENSTPAGKPVVAYAPSGATHKLVTDDQGMVNLRLTEAGSWRFRAEQDKDGEDFIADFSFDVAPEDQRVRARPFEPIARPKQGWVDLGPKPYEISSKWKNGTGRVSAIAVHPEKEDLFYLGAATGGVWECQGGKCKILTNNLPSASVGAITVDPHNPSTIYAGSGEPTYRRASYYGDGIYKSTDAGKTWKVLAKKQFSGRAFSKIVVSPDDPKVVWAAVMRPTRSNSHPGAQEPEVGLFKSTDAGKSFSRVEGLPKVVASDFAIDPKDSSVMYVGLAANDSSGGFYKSTDGGKTWKEKTSGLGNAPGVIEFSIAASQTSRIYMISANNGRTKVHVSSDGGESWSESSVRGLRNWEWYCVAVAADPDDPDVAIVGGINAYRTDNGGKSFSKISPTHVDMQTFVYDQRGNVLSGNDGGLQISSDNGRAWKPYNDGLSIVQFYPNFSRRPDDPDYFIGGTQDNGTMMLKDGKWTMVLGGDGGSTAIHPDNPNVVFASIYGTGAIHRSDNGGRSFKKVGGSIKGRSPWMAAFVFDPNDSKTIFYGTQRLWKSTNLGSSWSAISGDVASGRNSITDIAVAKTDSNIIYLSTTGGRFLASSDGGKNFDTKLEGLKGPWTAHDHIRIAPWDAKTVYLGIPHFGKDRVRVSHDQGETWTVLDGNLRDSPVNSLDVVRIGEGRSLLLAGTDHGIYASCDENKQWRLVDSPFNDAHILGIRYEEKGQRVSVLTFGRGAWNYEGATSEWLLSLCEPAKDDDKGKDDGDDGDDGKDGSKDDDQGDEDPKGSDKDDKGGKDGKGDKDGKGGKGDKDGKGGKDGKGDDSKDSGEDTEGDPKEEGGEDKGGCQLHTPAKGLSALFGLALLALRRRK